MWLIMLVLDCSMLQFRHRYTVYHCYTHEVHGIHVNSSTKYVTQQVIVVTLTALVPYVMAKKTGDVLGQHQQSCHMT